MHGDIEGLALDVPERLVDAGERAHVDAAAAVETGAVHDGPVILDEEWVLPDEVVAQLTHRGGHGVRASLEHWLTPARDSLVGLDLEKAPARWNEECGEARDSHVLS